MCQALMEWETIDRDQVLEIMAGKQPSPPKDYSHNIRPEAVPQDELTASSEPEQVEAASLDKPDTAASASDK